MFIDDSRKILSCRINAEYGVVLIEKLQRTPDEASQTRGVALPHVTVAPASDYDNDNDIDMLLESPQRTSPELHGTLGNSLGILSDQILSSANRQPYDRDWMTKYNINEDCLNGPPSRHKVDVLLRYGAIKAGDKLCITYHPDGAPALRYGEILKCPKSGRLDIRIAPARADFDGILHDCKGPKDVIRRMDKAFQIKQPLNVSEAWKIVSVVSEHGRDVGSLWKVRQAYQVFTDEMAEWGSRNRQNSP